MSIKPNKTLENMDNKHKRRHKHYAVFLEVQNTKSYKDWFSIKGVFNTSVAEMTKFWILFSFPVHIWIFNRSISYENIWHHLNETKKSQIFGKN